MEELFAYALLFSEGYDFWKQYSERLDKLFLESPDNEEYLYLETLKSPKEAVLHIIAVMSETSFDTDLFGRTLMKLLGQIYEKSDLADFGTRMYSLWVKLPKSIGENEPFFTLCFADDYLLWDEEQGRKLYEKAIHYYDQK